MSEIKFAEPPREEDLPNKDDIEYLARTFLQSRKEIDRQFHELLDGHVGFECSSNQKMFRLKLIYNELHHNVSDLLSQTKTLADNVGIKDYQIPEEES